MYVSPRGRLCLVRGSPRPWPVLPLLVGLLGGLLSGCAALTNPVADGVPVRLLPPELLARPKEPGQTIPLTLLGQPRPATYRLAPGDVLGVYIEGVLGEAPQMPPVHVSPLLQVREQRRLPPAAGYPVAVDENGTVVLPLVGALPVQGLSVPEAREAIRALYAKKQILKPGKELILVTLLHSRQYQVLVLRQEAANLVFNPEGLSASSKRGTGHVVDLPAYENDVLHALTQTGGLPGLDAYNEIIIQRDCFHNDQERAAVRHQLEALPGGRDPCKAIGRCGQVLRIPLRMPPGEKPSFGPEDVILRSGDVVFLEARDSDRFFTGGLLPPGAHVMPRDYDLDVVEAVTQVRGPLFNGAFGGSNLSGVLIAPGLGSPSPSLLVVLRRTPGGGQVPIVVDLKTAVRDPRERLLVQAGDVLILQEMPGEALARYFTQAFLNFDLFWQVIHTRFATGVLDVAAPDRLPGRIGVATIATGG